MTGTKQPHYVLFDQRDVSNSRKGLLNYADNMTSFSSIRNIRI